MHEGEGGEEAAGEGEADVADPVDPVPVEQHRPQSLNPSRPDTHKKIKIGFSERLIIFICIKVYSLQSRMSMI